MLTLPIAYSASVPGMVYNIVPWLMVNRPGASYPRVKTFFESLRKEEGSTVPVFAAGFCWGGKHVALLGADDVDGSLLVAAFTGHPSMLDVPGEIEKIHIPASFAVGDHDPHVPVDKAKEIQKIVEAKPDGQKGEMKIYDGCSHGFCVRADTGSFDVAQQAVAAEDQCIAWFDKHLKP